MSQFFDFFLEENKKVNKEARLNKNSDTNNCENEEESEDENFTRALNKKAFQGKKGQMLMELQKSYKADDRFIMDKRFQGDLDVTKISQKLKDMSYTFDEKNLNKESRKINFTKNIETKADHKKESEKTEEINIIAHNLSLNNFSELKFKEKLEEEKMKNLSILSSIISNQEFLSLSKKINNPSQLLVKRFDPTLNIGQNLIVEKEKRKIEESKNLVKLGKGMEIKSDFDIQREFAEKNNKKEMKKLDQLRKDEKERLMKKIANEVNDDLEPVIEVNYDIWKNVSKSKTKKAEGFSLFSSDENKESKSGESSKTNNDATGDDKISFILFGDNDENNNKSNEKKGFSLFDEDKPIKKKVVENEGENQKNKKIVDEINKNKKENKDKNKEKDLLDINANKKRENIDDLKNNKIKDSSIKDKNKKEKISLLNSDKEKELTENIDKTINQALIDTKVEEKIKNKELLKKKRERIKEKKEALKLEEIKKSKPKFLIFIFFSTSKGIYEIILIKFFRRENGSEI